MNARERQMLKRLRDAALHAERCNGSSTSLQECEKAAEAADALLAEPAVEALALEWSGLGSPDGSSRRVQLVVSELSVIVSDSAVQWARMVINALVFGLSKGRYGAPVQTKRDWQPQHYSTYLLMKAAEEREANAK